MLRGSNSRFPSKYSQCVWLPGFTTVPKLLRLLASTLNADREPDTTRTPPSGRNITRGAVVSTTASSPSGSPIGFTGAESDRVPGQPASTTSASSVYAVGLPSNQISPSTTCAVVRSGVTGPGYETISQARVRECPSRARRSLFVREVQHGSVSRPGKRQLPTPCSGNCEPVGIDLTRV